jgi:ABC-type branched-subunit amino acid transport system substrate-binding protein
MGQLKGARVAFALLSCTVMSVVGLVSGGGAPAAASSYPSIPAGPIEIGLSAPLSGPLALDGKVISETDQIAANYVNNTLGGIDGHKIKLVTLDDQDNATVGVQVAEQLAGGTGLRQGPRPGRDL